MRYDFADELRGPDPSASPRLYLLSIIAAGMSLAVVGMIVWWVG